MEKAMAPHSSTLAWKIPWMQELQSMGSLGVGHDWVTSLSLFTFMHWRRKWQPTQCSCLENPRDGGACWAAVYGVAQSRTRLKRLSSSSNSSSNTLDSWHSWTKFRWRSGEKANWVPGTLLLPGKSHGWRSLVGYSRWGRTESDTTEAT